MNIAYNGFHTDVLSMEADGNINIGSPVIVNDKGFCHAASNNAEIFGVAVSKRDELIGVQLTGYVELPYTSTAPTHGYCKLVCSNATSVKVSENGRQYKVIKVDTANKIVGFILA